MDIMQFERRVDVLAEKFLQSPLEALEDYRDKVTNAHKLLVVEGDIPASKRDIDLFNRAITNLKTVEFKWDPDGGSLPQSFQQAETPKEKKTIEDMVAKYKDACTKFTENEPRPEEYQYDTLGSIDEIIAKSNKRKKQLKKQQAEAAAAAAASAGFDSGLFKLDQEYIRAVPGLFALLRMLLIDHELKKQRKSQLGLTKTPFLSTAQLEDRVREWQMDEQIRRLNGQWIDKSSDWSLFVEEALIYLTGDQLVLRSYSIIPKSELNLPECPRPFVDAKAKCTHWSWITAADSEDSQNLDEKRRLSRLFPDWHKIACKYIKPVTPQKKPGKADKFSPTSLAQKLTSKAKYSATSKKQAKLSKTAQVLAEEGPEQESVEVGHQIPKALYPTSWKVRKYTMDESLRFRRQEVDRFSRPWDPFVYNVNGYSSIVGPLRYLRTHSSKSYLDLMQNQAALQQLLNSKPRHHVLLRPDRPSVVGMTEIVRDAVARLPNGEGTRHEIVLLASESGFLVSNYDQKQFNQCITSALDRLQNETDSPVIYSPSQRIWIYTHRDRNKNDFLRIFTRQCMVEDKKRMLKRGEGSGLMKGGRYSSDDDDQHSSSVSENQYVNNFQQMSKRGIRVRGRGASTGLGGGPSGRKNARMTSTRELDQMHTASSFVPDIDDLIRLDQDPRKSAGNRRGYQMSLDTAGYVEQDDYASEDPSIGP